ncbi:MAG: extracellular solute-binding protein [Verrucomicrobiae bacterium]|nr:extracellular solute-binding protein [Verrucomicrobiae bacterium]
MYSPLRPRLLLLLGVVWTLLGLAEAGASTPEKPAGKGQPVELVMADYIPDWLDNPQTILTSEFIAANPDVLVRPFIQLRLPNQSNNTSMMLLSFAGGIGPDVFRVWFHQLESWVNQGFVMDLSEFIGSDENGDGIIDDSEARVPEWKTLSPALRRVATINGKPYGFPAGNAVSCIIYRRDLVREITGSDEAPRTWDEFFSICQKLTRDAQKLPNGEERPSRRGFFADPNTFRWLPWMWSAGGREIVQVRRAKDGTLHEFPKEQIQMLSPTGENLANAPLQWKATFASPEGKQAMEFYWRLFWQKWIRDPKTGEPVNLTDAQAARGEITLPDGRKLTFQEKDVFTGVTRGLLGDNKKGAGELFRKGEICFYIGFAGEVTELLNQLSTSQIGLMAIPSPDGSRLTANIQPNFWFCLNSTVAKDAPEKRRKAFELLKTISGDNFLRADMQVQRQKGMIAFADPEYLKKFGMEESIPDVAEHWRKSLEEIKKNSFTEPYVGKWEPVSVNLIGREIISRIMSDRSFDYKAAMDQAQEVANNKVLGERDEAQMRKLRSWFYWIFAVILVFFLWMCKKMWEGISKAHLQSAASGFDNRVTEANAISRILPWVFLLPSIALVLMWTYYPLAQGGVMAFQDYRIMAAKPFVGLDNFITVLTDPKFYKYLWITVKFVAVNLTLGFFAPIILAIMLNEIPWGKMTMRMIFLLPTVSSGIVITFIWLSMYHPNEQGFFNSVLLGLGWIQKPLQFLNDANWALVWVTIPSVWGSLGAGSLIYLAALKSVPEDLYEAAEIDGAGFWHKLFKITIPTLFPLILINFIGSFIGLFRSMGNIFLMTGGGPGDETTVISYAIFQDSFIFLKFGTATATAWMLATLLVAFTILQLKILSKVEFRKAEE